MRRAQRRSWGRVYYVPKNGNLYLTDAFGSGDVIKLHDIATYAATARYIGLDNALDDAVTITFHLGMFVFGHKDI